MTSPAGMVTCRRQKAAAWCAGLVPGGGEGALAQHLQHQGASVSSRDALGTERCHALWEVCLDAVTTQGRVATLRTPFPWVREDGVMSSGRRAETLYTWWPADLLPQTSQWSDESSVALSKSS